MIEQPMRFYNYDNVLVEQKFHFHLSRKEILDLDMPAKLDAIEELEARFKRLIEESKLQPNDRVIDSKQVRAIQDFMTVFEDIVVSAYGVREGDLFRKGEQVRQDFKDHAAFSDFLFMFAENVDEASRFIEALIPRSVADDVRRQQAGMTASQAARAQSEARMTGHQAPKQPEPAPLNAPAYQEVPYQEPAAPVQRPYDPQQGTFGAPNPPFPVGGSQPAHARESFENLPQEGPRV